MTNVISKLRSSLETWSFKYNCYEAVHPWTPFCSDCALDIGITVFGEAIKLYTPLYLFSQIVQRKFDLASFRNTSESVVRSTTFISANAFFALLFFCSSQYATGKFYYYAVAYVPAFVASSMAVMIEKPSRRSSLAFYVANVASEAVFRLWVARGFVTPVKHGQVYIFALSIATIMMLARRHGFEDDPLSAAIRTIVGHEEAGQRRRRRPAAGAKALADSEHPEQPQPSTTEPCRQQAQETRTSTVISRPTQQGTPTSGLWAQICSTLDQIRALLHARHPLCAHQQCSCLSYCVRAASRALLMGYSAQFSLKLASKFQLVLAGRPLDALAMVARDPGPLKLGAFLSLFAGGFKAASCALRWHLDAWAPWQNFVAALVASPAMLVYPSPTVALYVMWKSIEIVFNEQVRLGTIRHKNACIVVLYGLATSQLFYSALMNPRYMKKSYMAFLDRMSRHRLHMINRSVLDVFGTEASSGYEDFYPDLHPKYLSDAFLGSIWLWMIEQKMVAKQLPA